MGSSAPPPNFCSYVTNAVLYHRPSIILYSVYGYMHLFACAHVMFIRINLKGVDVSI